MPIETKIAPSKNKPKYDPIVAPKSIVAPFKLKLFTQKKYIIVGNQVINHKNKEAKYLPNIIL